MAGDDVAQDVAGHGALVLAGGAVLVVLVAMRLFASQVYDALICNMTKTWYAAVLDRLDPKARVLDVGIGTAEALMRNKDTFKSKGLRLVGVDYDANYIATAKSKVASAGLQDCIEVHCKSIFDSDLGKTINKGSDDRFDAAYFSGSWTLMPGPVQALRIAASFVKDDGLVYVTQTFQRRSTPFLGVIKPMLKYITTVDFGPLHFEADLERYIAEASTPVDGVALALVENGLVPGSIDNRFQSARLVVFKKTLVK